MRTTYHCHVIEIPAGEVGTAAGGVGLRHDEVTAAEVRASHVRHRQSDRPTDRHDALRALYIRRDGQIDSLITPWSRFSLLEAGENFFASS